MIKIHSKPGVLITGSIKIQIAVYGLCAQLWLVKNSITGSLKKDESFYSGAFYLSSLFPTSVFKALCVGKRCDC